MSRAELWTEASRRQTVRLCAAITGDRQAAEDLAQETLFEAWRNAHKLHDPAGADRWLAAVARNVCRRWARSRGRDLAVAAAAEQAQREAARTDLEVELEREELVGLLDRALGLLPPETRDVLVQRYVHDSPHRRIAERLGLSEDAVSMRLTRGKLALRRVLAAELVWPAGDAGWRETRVWCLECARRRLHMRRTETPAVISFSCPGCKPEPAAVSAEYRLDDPELDSLLGGLVRPTAILRRAAEWQVRSYGEPPGECRRCSTPLALAPYGRDELAVESPSAHGLAARCRHCGETAYSFSIGGLGTSLPELRRFRQEHPRSRLQPLRTVEHGGVPAFVLRLADEQSSAGADVLFARADLRLLHVAAG